MYQLMIFLLKNTVLLSLFIHYNIWKICFVLFFVSVLSLKVRVGVSRGSEPC